MDMDDDAVAAAADLLSQTIASYTSPRLEHATRLRGAYHSSIDLLKRDEVKDETHWADDDEDMTNIYGAASTLEGDTRMMPMETPQLKPPHPAGRSLERAETPVMSNSSSRGDASRERMRHERGLLSPDLTMTGPSAEELREIPANVMSPWPVMEQRITAVPVRNTPGVVARTNPSSTSSHAHYSRYYDILLSYRIAKQDLYEKLDFENQRQSLSNHLTATELVNQHSTLTYTTTSFARLVEHETKIELDFLRSMSGACYDRSTGSLSDVSNLDRKECNFWSLLYCLRQLDLTCLIWNDDAASINQDKNVLSTFLEELSRRVHDSPDALVEATKVRSVPTADGTSAATPMILLRRRQILRWLQQSFEKDIPPGCKRSRTTQIVSDSLLLKQEALIETDKDNDLLYSALHLILAGQLEDAQKVFRNSGVPWRAASWGGGHPHRYSIRYSMTDQNGCAEIGNPRRALWKRIMWKHSIYLQQDPAASKPEAAIVSILSSNLKSSLANPTLQTWEKGLYVTLRAVVDRMEDELLHMHNNHRRKMRPPFPGTEHERMEREHLEATSDLAGLHEVDVVRIVSSAPDGEMRSDDMISKATEAFLIGKNAVKKFLDSSLVYVERDCRPSNVRFLAHLALYLDSLESSTTPVVLAGYTEWKNEILLRYVHYLASRDDLWWMVVLYASLLPIEIILHELPAFLVNRASPEERQVIVKQLRDFLPSRVDEISVLTITVRQILNEDDKDNLVGDVPSEEMYDRMPTQLDDRKMKALDWLFVHEDHYGYALIETNRLLRQFLHANKRTCATMLVFHIIPDIVLAKVHELLKYDENKNDMMEANETPVNLNDMIFMKQLKHSYSEFNAFQSYLQALEDYSKFRIVLNDGLPRALSNNTTDAMMVDDPLDRTLLNATEISVADHMERREWLEKQRTDCVEAVRAAETARKSLLAVLMHPGGWLLTDDQPFTDMMQSTDDQERHSDLRTLRMKLLPSVIHCYLDVCTFTAELMFHSLMGVMERLDRPDPKMALMMLDNLTTVTTAATTIVADQPYGNVMTTTATNEVNVLSPSYWTGEAMELVPVISSNTYVIGSVLNNNEIKDFLKRVAKIMVQHSMYQEQFGRRKAA